MSGFRTIIGMVNTILNRMYARLAMSETPCPADLIFVLAGLPERKRYGWDLFERGFAPKMLVSVGRNEARFLKTRAGLREDGGIIGLLPLRPKDGNHIFLWAEQHSVRPEVVHLAELNTFGEITALCAVIRQLDLQHVLIVSTDVHLRRIRYATRRVIGLRGLTQVQMTYLGVPGELSTFHRHRWWSRRQDARLIITEWVKLAGYYIKYGLLQRSCRYSGFHQVSLHL